MTTRELIEEIERRNVNFKSMQALSLANNKEALEDKKKLILNLPYQELFDMLLTITDCDPHGTIQLPVEFTKTLGAYIEFNGFRIAMKKVYNTREFSIICTRLSNVSDYIILYSNKPKEVTCIHRQGYEESEENQLKSFIMLADALLDHYNEFEKCMNSIVENMLRS